MQGVASLPYDLEENTEIDLPNGGIMGSNRKTAKFMLDQMGKEYGRGGDTVLGHLTEGETVIPVKLLEENPAMTTIIRKTFADNGLDMNRYIVGDELNVHNPVTGQPEFFIKKVFKKIRKAVKKVFKKLKKVVKKLAPIVLPIIAPMALPLLGGVFATMGTATMVGIGSMAGSLIAGADFKDALKAGAMGALTAGVVQGGVSKFRGGTFGEGFTSSFTGAPNTSIPTQSIDVVDKGMTTAEIDALSPDVGAGVEAGGIDPGATGGTLDTRLPVNPDPLRPTIDPLRPTIEIPEFQQKLSFDTVRPDNMGLDITSTATPDVTQVANVSQTAPTMADLNAQIDALGIGQAPNPANIANIDPSQLRINPNYSGQLGDPNFNLDMNMDYLSQTNPMSGQTFGAEVGITDPSSAFPKLNFGDPIPDKFLGSETLSKITPDFIEKPLEAAGRGTRDFYNKYISPSRTPAGYTPPPEPMSAFDQAAEIDRIVQSGSVDRATATKLVLHQSDQAVKLASQGAAGTATGATHGAIRAYAPLAAIGTGAAYLGGAFEEEYEDTTPNEEAAKLVSVPTGVDVYANAPLGTYAPSAQQFYGGSMLGQYMPRDYSQQMLANRRQFYPEAFLGTYGEGRPLYGAADGGAVNGPGTGTSDDIPAMLSDGEFVMTAKAVRGAGNGSRQAGAQRMYDMMHEFESAAGR